MTVISPSTSRFADVRLTLSLKAPVVIREELNRHANSSCRTSRRKETGILLCSPREATAVPSMRAGPPEKTGSNAPKGTQQRLVFQVLYKFYVSFFPTRNRDIPTCVLCELNLAPLLNANWDQASRPVQEHAQHGSAAQPFPSWP